MRYTFKDDPDTYFYAYCKVPVWPTRWYEGTVMMRCTYSQRAAFMLKAAYPNMFGDVACPTVGSHISSFGVSPGGNPFPILREMMDRIGAVADGDMDLEERETRIEAIIEARQDLSQATCCLQRILTIKSLHRSSATEAVEVKMSLDGDLLLCVDRSYQKIGSVAEVSKAIHLDVPEAVWDDLIGKMLEVTDEISVALRAYRRWL